MAKDTPSAKREAFNDIVSQISVEVDFSFSESLKDEDGKLTSSLESKSTQKSNAVLNDYELLKSEYYNSKYFVAIEYENIPSLDKFVAKIKDAKTQKQNSYLKKSLVAKELRGKLKKDIDFNLLRKDKKWFIQHKSILYPLDKKDFSKFFTSVSNDSIKIKTDKKRDILYDGDRFFFKVESAKKGFISIISVYEDGTVATLVRNIVIGKNKLENIPDKDFETIPEAGLIQKGVETYDLYVAIYSEKKIRFDSFAYADEELISEEKYKNFDALINFWMEKLIVL